MQTKELLAEIDSLKTEIEKLRPLKPEVEHKIMQKFRLDWNYHSNAIEGNRLTLGETRVFLTEELTAKGKPWRDHLDIRGHNELLQFLPQYIERGSDLTESDIREMHKILLGPPYDLKAETEDGQLVKKRIVPGDYKLTPNFVRTGSGEIHHYELPEAVIPMMGDLVSWHRSFQKNDDWHPITHAALLHYRYLRIHPFDDGNGRLGRVLMNFVLMKHGFPPVVIKKDQRDQYLVALRKADAGERTDLIDFLAECLLDSMRLYLRGARGGSIEDADDVDKEVEMLKQELKNVPKPTQLSVEVQANLIVKRIVPLLDRLNAKLTQFDDLFAKNEIQVRGMNELTGSQIRTMPRQEVWRELLSAFSAHTGASIEIRRDSENILITPPPSPQARLGNLAPSPNRLFRFLQMEFRWEGFQGDGPNAFDVQIEMIVGFEPWQYRIEIKDIQFNQTLAYQEWLSEAQEDALISGMAKEILTRIKSRRRK